MCLKQHYQKPVFNNNNEIKKINIKLPKIYIYAFINTYKNVFITKIMGV